MIRLQVLPDGETPFESALEGEEVVVGRSSESGLVVPDQYLSRHHARLFVEDGRWMVEDLGSHNGTRLNGVRIEKAEPVHVGDRIGLSGSVLSVLELSPGGEGSPRKASSLSSSGFLESESHFAECEYRPASDILSGDSSLDSVRGEEQLRLFAERFRILNDVHQALASSLTLDEVLDLILDRIFDHLQPEEGVIILRNADGGFGRVAQRRAPGWTEEYFYSRTLLEEVAVKGMAVRVVDLRTDDRFSGSESIASAGVLSLIAAPLMTSEESLGLIVLTSRLTKRHFTDRDVELLAALASVAAMRIRNHHLAEAAAERRLLEQELALAREIQVGLLPKTLPKIAGYEIDAQSIPSRGVSGDFYKLVERSGGSEWVLLAADVSGKGMAASLLTATAEALAAVSIAEGLAPERICHRMSVLLEERTPAEKFVTAFLGVLEPESGRLVWANAGHNPALLLRASGEVERLGSTGVPLGLLPGAEYGSAESGLEPGDALVVYTDGITEAADASGEEYGIDRLIAACRACDDKGRLIGALDADLVKFTGGVPFADDRTLVVVCRSGPLLGRGTSGRRLDRRSPDPSTDDASTTGSDQARRAPAASRRARDIAS